MKITKSQLKQIIKEELKNTMNEGQYERFTGGSIDIDPLSDEEQTAATKAYYDLRSFLEDDGTWVDAETGRSPAALPGGKPSEKLRSALRWIAKFEQGAGEPDDIPSDDDPESEYSGFQDRSGPSDTPDEPEEKEYDPADSPFTRPKAARYR